MISAISSMAATRMLEVRAPHYTFGVTLSRPTSSAHTHARSHVHWFKMPLEKRRRAP
jgi:hypothetical protein